MELIRGRAKNVRESNVVSSSGSGNSLSVSTRFRSAFSLNDREVQFVWDDGAVILDGDEVVITGETDSTGVFVGLAYVNVTRGVGHAAVHPWGWKAAGIAAALMGAILLILAGLLALSLLVGPLERQEAIEMAVSAGFGVVFVLGGLWLCGRGKYYAKAISMIRRESEKRPRG